jgi:transposase-like protein/uncharacterized coiled-coil protein SlyX
MLSRAGDVPQIPKRLSLIKPPERCPHCNSTHLIKKGTRKKKFERVPLYRCRACGRTFAPGPLAIRNKTYPLPEILEALTLYNRGNTLEDTARKISSRYGHRVAPSTISRWLSEHQPLPRWSIGGEETVTLKDFQAFQRQTADSLQSAAQDIATQKADLERLSDQVSALAAKIDALQSAAAPKPLQTAVPARPAVPLRPAVIAQRKKPPAPKTGSSNAKK